MKRKRKHPGQYWQAFKRGLGNSFIDRMVFPIVVAGIIFWGVLIITGDGWLRWDATEPTIGIFTLVFLFFVWVIGLIDRAERAELITIILCCKDKKPLTLPYHPPRTVLSRAEIQGILGLYFGPDRYDSSKIVRNIVKPLDDEPISRLEAVTRGYEDTLHIDVDEDFYQKVSDNLNQK